VLRRRGTTRQQVLVVGDLSIDQDTREVRRGEKLIELTPREYDLLKLFMFNARQVLSKESILERVWGYDFEGGERTIDSHIRRLRQRIEWCEELRHVVQTVRGFGYRFARP